MKYNLQELYNELLDQRYDVVQLDRDSDNPIWVIDYDDVITAIKNLDKELREMQKQAESKRAPYWHETHDLFKEILGE